VRLFFSELDEAGCSWNPESATKFHEVACVRETVEILSKVRPDSAIVVVLQ
jgi:hypothetical protein